jgi:hypothetical protein
MSRSIPDPMDWGEFRKLFKVPIPVPEHGEYTVSVLSRSREFADLPAQVAAFRAFEARHGGSARKVRLATLDALVAYLAGTAATARLNQAPLPEPTPSRDRRGANVGRMWVGLDLVSANFHTLARFDEDGELHGSWSALCEVRGVDPLLARSKSFRQIVFGNLNPKRNQRHQAAVIAALAVELDRPGRDVVYLERDELVLASDAEPVEVLHAAIAEVAARAPVPARTTIRRWIPIAKGEYVAEAYEPGEAAPAWRGLTGVPGNRFLPAFKEHILGEALDERDLLFLVDGRLARWVA